MIAQNTTVTVKPKDTFSSASMKSFHVIVILGASEPERLDLGERFVASVEV